MKQFQKNATKRLEYNNHDADLMINTRLERLEELKNVPKATEWAGRAQQAGNNSASLKQLQTYLQGASGDYTSIEWDAAAAVAAAATGRRRCS